MQSVRDEMNNSVEALAKRVDTGGAVKDFALHSVCSVYTPLKNSSTSSDLILFVSKWHASKVPPRSYSVQHAPDLLNLVKHSQSQNDMLYMAVQGLVKMTIQSLHGNLFCCSAQVYS